MGLAAGSFMALTAAYGLAATFHPARKLAPSARLTVIAILASAIAVTPLLVPSSVPLARLVVAIVAACLILKLVDLHLAAERSHALDALPFAAYLGNVVHLVQRRTGVETQPSATANRRNLLSSLLGMLLALVVLLWSGRVDWSQWPFLLQHAVRAGAFLVGVHFMFLHLAAMMRAIGMYSIDPERRPFLACTPAEFWRRYNRFMGQFLHFNVFVPLGGRRHPVRATLLVFALSGLLHEYLFLVATGRLHGYQMAFFMLQGVAVALTLRIKPSGAMSLVWWMGTWTFHVLTSLLFFASLHSVAAFYPTGLPPWLPAP
jgi:hypothetical protein